jgi:hypothetical protein
MSAGGIREGGGCTVQLSCRGGRQIGGVCHVLGKTREERRKNFALSKDDRISIFV